MTTDNARFEIDKIFRQLDFIDGSFALNLWANAEHAANVRHDVALMRAFGDAVSRALVMRAD